MPVEVPSYAPPAEPDFADAYRVEADETPDVAPEADLESEYTPPSADLPEPETPEDFTQYYQPPSITPATDAAAAGIEPTPAPTPEIEEAYSIGPTPLSDAAASKPIVLTPEVEEPPREEIRATEARDIPAQLLQKIGEVTDNVLSPGQPSGASIMSPEVAAIPVGIFSGGARTAGKLISSLTGNDKYNEAVYGVEYSLAQALSGFSNLESIAGLLTFAIPGVAETYAVNVLSKLPEQYGRLKESIQAHGLISKETARAATDAGIQDLMGFLAGKAAGHVKIRSGEVIKNAVQIAKPQGEVLRAGETRQDVASDLGQVGVGDAEGTVAGAPQAQAPKEIISQPAETGGETVTETAVPNGAADLSQNLPRAREPMSPGPGAASVKEPLATYEERSFGKRLDRDEDIVASFKEDVGNKFYEPIPNKLTFDNAVHLVEERGIPESIRIMKDRANGLPFHLRSAMGQFMIKRLNKAIKNLGESPEAQRLQNHAIETAEWLMELGTELGQGVQSFAAWDRLTPEGKLIKLKEDIKKADLPELTEEQQADVIKLAAKIEEAAEGMPRDEATLNLSKYIANIKGFDAKDFPLGIYYGNMLSGYNTQIVNFADTLLNVLSEVNGMAMTNPKAALNIYGGLLRGFAQGKTDALLALTEGRMITAGKYMDAPRLMEVAKFGEKGGVPITVKGRPSRLIKSAAETKPAKIFNAWKYVMRLMSASDSVMFRGAFEARSALLADRLARGEGLTGEALHNRVNEILGLNEKAVQAFKQKAQAEGYTGAKRKARVAELSRQARPEDIEADATDFAGEATYNHDPHGILGYAAKGASKATENVPVLKTVIPFTQIVANVTNRGLNYSPFGFKRAFYGYGIGKLKEGAPVGDARAAMLMRATMGTTALGVILGAAEAGLVTVHGDGPRDREKRRQLLNTGWKPYSFQIGNRYFSYLPTPIGLEMSVMGNMMDSRRYNELGEKDALTRAGYTFSRLGSTIFSQSFLSGMSTMFRALSGDPGDTIASIKQYISSTAGAFISPRLATDIYRLFDPTAYRSENIAGDLLRNTPFAASVNKPTLNAFGETVQLPTNRFISKQTDDPVWQFVARTGIRISVPSRTTTVPDGEGGKRRITPEEYYSYLQTSGQELKSYISDNMDTLEGMDSEELQDKLTEEAKRIRKRVKDDLFQ